jgi:hypothetical protein
MCCRLEPRLQAYTALLQQSGGSFRDRQQLQTFIDCLKVSAAGATNTSPSWPLLSSRPAP